MAQARLKLTEWHGDDFVQRAEDITRVYTDEIEQVAVAMMREQRYDWPRPTLRKNGVRVPAGLRDIVDLGNLLEKRMVTRKANGANIRWTADYADAVISGKGDNNGPARDWITPALNELPIQPYFKRQWNRA